MEAVGIDNVHEVATLGDTVLDLQAGYNAGVRLNMGTLSGAHGRSKMERRTPYAFAAERGRPSGSAQIDVMNVRRCNVDGRMCRSFRRPLPDLY